MRPSAFRSVYLLFLVLVAAGLLAGIGWAVSRRAQPPRVVLMATGPTGGTYEAYGARYRQILARQGLEVRLRPTATSRTWRSCATRARASASPCVCAALGRAARWG